MPRETSSGKDNVGHSKDIAILTPIFPYPPDTGSGVRIFEIIKALSGHGFTIKVLSLEAGVSRERHLALSPWCDDVASVDGSGAPLRKEPMPSRAAQRLFGPPFTIDVDRRRRIEAILDRWSPDFIQLEKTVSSAFFPIEALRRRGVRIVLEEGGVHHVAYYREMRLERNPVRKALSIRRYLRLRHYERSLVRSVDAVVAVSGEEMDIVARHAGQSRCILAPNGVNERFAALRPAPVSQRVQQALFCGSMAYRPNADVVEQILGSIAPSVCMIEPAFCCHIAGSRRPENGAVGADGRRCVNWLGYVPDILETYASYAIFLNPMRLGGGTRLKLLEAMASGMACVSSAIGAEGIDAVHGHHLLIADTTEKTVAATLAILKEPVIADFLGSNARQLVLDRYGWSRCLKDLVAYYSG